MSGACRNVRANARNESVDHDVGPAQSRNAELLRASGGAHTKSRSACGARNPLYLVLDAIACLHPCTCLIRNWEVHPSDRLLG